MFVVDKRLPHGETTFSFVRQLVVLLRVAQGPLLADVGLPEHTETKGQAVELRLRRQQLFPLSRPDRLPPLVPSRLLGRPFSSPTRIAVPDADTSYAVRVLADDALVGLPLQLPAPGPCPRAATVTLPSPPDMPSARPPLLSGVPLDAGL